MKSWIESEFKESTLSGRRLKQRLLKLVKDLYNKKASA